MGLRREFDRRPRRFSRLSSIEMRLLFEIKRQGKGRQAIVIRAGFDAAMTFPQTSLCSRTSNEMPADLRRVRASRKGWNEREDTSFAEFPAASSGKAAGPDPRGQKKYCGRNGSRTSRCSESSRPRSSWCRYPRDKAMGRLALHSHCITRASSPCAACGFLAIPPT